jgi:apolipoprotein N-acyltransferase
MKPKDPRRRDVVSLFFILFRVAIILVTWLGVFLATFLGYFTVPMVLIGVVVLIYTVSDIGLFLAFRHKGNGSDQRKLFLKTFFNRSRKDR